jgi:hypothetical protein
MRAILLSLPLLLGLAIAVAGCGHAQSAWTAQPVTTSELRIMPAGISSRGDRLYVQTTFTNTGTETVTVDRDGVTLRLPDGHVVPRSIGTFTQHKPYVIGPGGSHAVYVDFKIDGQDWNQIPSAEVDWSKAVFIGDRPVAVPPTPLSSTPPQ